MKTFYEIATTPQLEWTLMHSLSLVAYIGGFVLCVLFFLTLAVWVTDMKQHRRK